MSGSWGGGWVLKYLFSYLHPFLSKDPRDGSTLSCVGGQSVHMSNHVFCDTPGPATHCSDPSILISRSQKLYQVTTWPWGSDFLSVGLSELSAKRGVCQGLRAGIFSKVGKGRNADSTAGKPVVRKTAQERWLRKRAHVSPMEKIPDKHCLTPLGLPSVSSPLAAGLGYKCYTAQTSAHLVQVEAHGYPQNCI